jgi:hypothetical protein
MQGGELIVTGSDHVEIILPERPEKIIVHFAGNDTHVPCDVHHHDELAWHTTKEHHPHHKYSSRYVLTIRWHVSGVRQIDWKVFY